MSNAYEELRALAAKCTFCGACHAVCPVFDKLAQETSCSRGRLFQLRFLSEERIKADKHLAETLSRCALCQACTAKCPASIKTTDIFMRLRKAVADEVPLPLAKRVAFTSLTYRALFNTLLGLGASFQGLLFKQSPDGPGRVSRLPLPAAGLNQRRLIPGLASRPLRRIVPALSRPERKKAKVVFFPGCMLNYVYPEAGKAVIDVLTLNGVEVHLPANLSCCGTPAITSGDFAAGKVLAEQNVRALQSIEADAIITACATCATALSHEYGLVLEDSPVLEAWQGLKGRVIDFSKFLVDFGFTAPTRPVERVVTYHDPCHLVRGMKVSKEPRALIKAVPGVAFKEMTDADRCCGCAGTFSASHYELSRRINDDKIDSIAATGADLAVTGCSACRMHIADGLNQRGVPCEVTHTAQLIAAGYGL